MTESSPSRSSAWLTTPSSSIRMISSKPNAFVRKSIAAAPSS